MVKYVLMVAALLCSVSQAWGQNGGQNAARATAMLCRSNAAACRENADIATCVAVFTAKPAAMDAREQAVQNNGDAGMIAAGDSEFVHGNSDVGFGDYHYNLGVNAETDAEVDFQLGEDQWALGNYEAALDKWDVSNPAFILAAVKYEDAEDEYELAVGNYDDAEIIYWASW